MDVINFLKSKFKKSDLELLNNPNGRAGVDFLVGDCQLYLQPMNLDETQRSIKILKEDLGKLRSDLFVVLVLVIDKEPRGFYLIPSTELEQSNGDIFIDNNVNLMPRLSNWEIKVSSYTIPKLARYSSDHVIDEFKHRQ
ncbi:hypothetical protein [Arenibacter sp. ARW7G5Y1]|uniref:hypothetical protein n=1 Tax=Arenibacter sp. ARW7G5Y1 TaxID=2135619 RepID=UPI000D769B52|nr:hypothetical protein [Arenibacter sp. ARW7G5Y1]PXX29722.1 hypothetical protein C7972_10391 [Arenibacter sp. ARW7G5Y1]